MIQDKDAFKEALYRFHELNLDVFDMQDAAEILGQSVVKGCPNVERWRKAMVRAPNEKLFPPGRFIVLEAMAFGSVRICISHETCQSFEDFWQYTDAPSGIIGLFQWIISDDEEPTGWVRASCRGDFRFRRRPDGDPAREYLAR